MTCGNRWAIGISLVAIVLSMLALFTGRPVAKPECPGCVIKREAAALQKKIGSLERSDLCPQCGAEWDAEFGPMETR